jgi:gliding motility-associatede transport system auxiliary component
MNNIKEQQPQPRGTSGGAWLLAEENRQKTGNALLIAALLFTAVFIIVVFRAGWTDVPVRVWQLGLALITGIMGLWVRLGGPLLPGRPQDALRLNAMILGGLVGFATVLLGLAMPLMMYRDIFAGGLESWRQHPWRVLACAAALFGGLTLMFLSLQLGRTVERTNAAVRRVLYGYNAILTGTLLASVLGLLNILSYAPVAPFKVFGRQWDWTSSGIYSLSPKTVDFVQTLDKPVKVYLLIPFSDPIESEAEILLNNFKSIAPNKFSWQSLSRDLNRKDLQRLVEKYPTIPEINGLLVVYGTEPNEQTEFIRRDDLFTDVRASEQGGKKFTFKGESTLMKSLTYLAEDKKRPVVYFTQGNGEPELLAPPTRRRAMRSFSELRERLTRANYEVKELKLTPSVDRIPADAEVVVVADPRTGLPDNAVKALSKYMNPTGTQRKGKLIVLADVAPGQDRSKMLQTGLEGLLSQFNVRLGNERLLANTNEITRLLAVMSGQSQNPLAQAFGDYYFIFDDARTVEPSSTGGAAGNVYRAETLMVTTPKLMIWKEPLDRDPVSIRERYQNPDTREELLKKALTRVSVAVTVTESLSAMPNIPQHAGMTGKEDKPRLVVFGDATWATDEILSTRLGGSHGDLFVSTLSWLRQRSGIGADAEGKERAQFTLAGTNPDVVSRIRLVPLFLLLIGIVGLGGGIWVVRRR